MYTYSLPLRLFQNFKILSFLVFILWTFEMLIFVIVTNITDNPVSDCRLGFVT